MGRTRKDDDEAKQVEGELLPALPTRTVNLNLSTTRKYIDYLLDRPAKEALELIEKQITLKLLLINEQTLKWLEVLDGATTWKERAEASHHIEVLEQAVSRIGEQRQNLLKALGVDQGHTLPENNPAPMQQPVETSVEDFNAEFAALNDPKLLTN